VGEKTWVKCGELCFSVPFHTANHANFIGPRFFIKKNGCMIPYSIDRSAHLCSSCLELFQILGKEYPKKLVALAQGQLSLLVSSLTCICLWRGLSRPWSRSVSQCPAFFFAHGGFTDISNRRRFDSSSHAAEKRIPFYPGEKLTFQVKWVMIPAAEAVLEIMPMEQVDGVRSFHFSMTARTYEAIDIVYKVRDRWTHIPMRR